MVPPLMHMFLETNSVKVILRIMGPTINCIMQFCKYTILLRQMSRIQKSVNAIKEDLTSATAENRLIFRSKVKILRRIVIVAAITMYGGGLCHRTVVPLLRGTIVTPDNVTIRPLPSPTHLIILDEQKSPTYEILFVLQVFAGFVAYAIVCGISGMSALLVLHTCSMLRILANKMNRLVDKKDVPEMMVQRRIADIVEYQMKIKRFLKNIETITENIYLIEMVGCSCLLCLIGYYIIMEWENNNTAGVLIYATLQTSFMFCIFIVCYIGQLLVDENRFVGQTSGMINYYHLSTKHMRSLILIIAMSNHPMKLVAGKMAEISLATFTDVMKMSMGYLNILREVV
ncbi:hypothetical protein QLX08_007743 [Tetragonisca angustula]